MNQKDEQLFAEWKLSRAKGIILEYMRGLKPRATLEWCIGCLTKSFGPSLDESLSLIKSIRNDPTIIKTPEREEKLAILEKELRVRWEKLRTTPQLEGMRRKESVVRQKRFVRS